MVDDFNPEFNETSLAIKHINKSLIEHSFNNDKGCSKVLSSSFILKELLQRQEESHKKIQALQRSIQKYNDEPSNVTPSTPRKLFENDVGSETKDTDSSFSEVIFKSFMGGSDDVILPFNDSVASEGSESPSVDTDDDADDLTTLGSYKEVVDVSLLKEKVALEVESDSSRSTIVGIGASLNDWQNLHEKYDLETDFQRQESESFKFEQEFDDELSICIDMMANRMKELELEKERVKLDVIVGLRKRFESMFHSNANSGSTSPNGMFEKLNDDVYKITLTEVEKIRQEEHEKMERMKVKHDERVEVLYQDIERLTNQKADLYNELENTRRKMNKLEEGNEKLKRVESRVSYLESLLQTIERENETLKLDLQKTEDESSLLHHDIKMLKETSRDSLKRFEETSAREAKIKTLYDEEHKKFMEERKEMKDEISSLQNQIENIKMEKERVVNSKETDLSIIKHLEEKLKRQGSLLDTMSADSTKYFESNLKLEKKTAEYKQKIKKSAYGIEVVQEENRRLYEEREAAEAEKTSLKRSLNESKRRESELQFQMRKLQGDWEQKEKDLKLQLETYCDRRINAGVNNSYAVLDKNKWNRSLGNVITSSMRNNMTSSNVGEKLNLSPKHTMYQTSPKNHSPKANFSESESGFEGSPIRENLLQSRTWPHANGNHYTTHYDFDSPTLNKTRTNCSMNKMNASDATPSTKYRSDDTRMFLKEMSYKLEHTEAALKLADHDDYTTPSILYDSAENLQNRLHGLRDEVLNL